MAEAYIVDASVLRSASAAADSRSLTRQTWPRTSSRRLSVVTISIPPTSMTSSSVA